MDVIITPSSEAGVILSQLASSKLNNPRDVALCGESGLYWDMVRFYSFCGSIRSPIVTSLLSTVYSEAVSNAMSKGSILDRASSVISDDSMDVVRPKYGAYPFDRPTAAKTEGASHSGGLVVDSDRGRGADAPSPDEPTNERS